MKIAVVYSGIAFGRHREPFDFSDIEGHKTGLTGTDAIALNYPRELAARGHDVTLYCYGVTESTNYDGVVVSDFARWGAPHGEGLDGWDAAIAVSNPNCLKDANPEALRCVNRQVARFGVDTLEYETHGYDAWVDLYFCPSEYSVRLVSAGLPHPEKFRVLPDGCYPEMFRTEGMRTDARLKTVGQVAYVSSPDRGLHNLLEVWPEVRRRVPHATLVVAYQSLESWMEFHTDPAKRMSGPVDEECTRRALYVRNALRKLRDNGVRHAGGGMSHRDVVRLLCESEVLAYPCDPLAPTETFSVAVLEACAAGCAAVISDADCLGEVHGHAAAVVRAPVRERLGEFTDLVVRGLTEPGFRAALGELGREHARAHDWRKLAAQLEVMLEMGIAEKRSAGRDFASALKDPYLTRVESLEKVRIDLVLTPYASGPEPIDVDRPFDSNSGGGCRAGFMGLVHELPKLGYEVRAYSTFRQIGDEFANCCDGVEYRQIGTWQPGRPLPFQTRDVLLAYYDTSPLVGASGCLRVASHHTFNIPFPGAFEWTDLNLAPSQYAVDALRPVFDTAGAWAVMPNGLPFEEYPEWVPVLGRCLWHTSPSRGLWNVLEAWPLIQSRVPHATLHVVGDVGGWIRHYGEVPNRQGDVARRTAEALEKLSKLYDFAGVRLRGRLSRAEMLRELSEAACFPFAFEAVGPCETFSICTAECMAMGIPVVMQVGDALDSIYGRAAKILKGAATGAFADAVADVLLGSEGYQLSENGHYCVSCFTFENKAKALDRAIRDRLGYPHDIRSSVYEPPAGSRGLEFRPPPAESVAVWGTAK